MAMSKGTRIYTHPAVLAKRLSFPSDSQALGVLRSWRDVGYAIVAVGCEEGAMAVHLRWAGPATTVRAREHHA